MVGHVKPKLGNFILVTFHWSIPATRSVLQCMSHMVAFQIFHDRYDTCPDQWEQRARSTPQHLFVYYPWTFFPFLTRVVGLLWVDFGGGLGYCALLCCCCCNQTTLLGLCSILLNSPLPLGLLQREERTAVPWKWQGMVSVSVVTGPGYWHSHAGKGALPGEALCILGPPCWALLFGISVRASGCLFALHQTI